MLQLDRVIGMQRAALSDYLNKQLQPGRELRR